jgi:hypothetical protein
VFGCQHCNGAGRILQNGMEWAQSKHTTAEMSNQQKTLGFG